LVIDHWPLATDHWPLITACCHHPRPLAQCDGGDFFHVDTVEAGLGRMPLAQVAEKRLDRRSVALHFDPHYAGFVADPAGQSPSASGVVDERPEAHALHDASHRDGQAASRWHFNF
jgi:hypothetical protein